MFSFAATQLNPAPLLPSMARIIVSDARYDDDRSRLQLSFGIGDGSIEIGYDVRRGCLGFLRTLVPRDLEKDAAGFVSAQDVRDRFLKALRYPSLDVVCPQPIPDYSPSTHAPKATSFCCHCEAEKANVFARLLDFQGFLRVGAP